MLKKLMFCTGCALAICAAAFADISQATIETYNNAVQSNDRDALFAAATALSNEAIASPEDDQSALLAYEAAWALCRYGKCKEALPAAAFAVSQPDTGQHPSLADRQLLLAFAGWKTNQDRRTRKALDDALADRVGDTPSLLTVAAFQARYLEDAESTRKKQLATSARDAATHFYPVRDQITEVWSHAAILATVSGFGKDHEPSSLVDMAKIAAELGLMRHMQDDAPEWLDKSALEAAAWTHAMSAYFLSEGKGKDERELADEILKTSITDDSHEHAPGSGPHRSDGLLMCRGDFTSKPRPSFPEDAAWDGYVGAVIVLFDADESGAKNVRIGASVPSDVFDKAALDSIRGLEWKWEESAAGDPPCVKSRPEIQWPFYFVLD